MNPGNYTDLCHIWQVVFLQREEEQLESAGQEQQLQTGLVQAQQTTELAEVSPVVESVDHYTCHQQKSSMLARNVSAQSLLEESEVSEWIFLIPLKGTVCNFSCYLFTKINYFD